VQADGVPIFYIAASQPRTTGAAILVREDSPICTPEYLWGRRIGLVGDSFHNYFLISVLDAAGVSYPSVEVISWPAKDSLRALRSGEIEAWISTDPYLAPALAGGGVRSLIGCDKVIPNRSVLWIHKDVAAHGRAVVETLARTLADADRWIGQDARRAAKLFARVIGASMRKAGRRALPRSLGESCRPTAPSATSSRSKPILSRVGTISVVSPLMPIDQDWTRDEASDGRAATH
jgi:sulfonate transport system substrate-binding protein